MHIASLSHTAFYMQGAQCIYFAHMHLPSILSYILILFLLSNCLDFSSFVTFTLHILRKTCNICLSKSGLFYPIWWSPFLLPICSLWLKYISIYLHSFPISLSIHMLHHILAVVNGVIFLDQIVTLILSFLRNLCSCTNLHSHQNLLFFLLLRNFVLFGARVWLCS